MRYKKRLSSILVTAGLVISLIAPASIFAEETATTTPVASSTPEQTVQSDTAASSTQSTQTESTSTPFVAPLELLPMASSSDTVSTTTNTIQDTTQASSSVASVAGYSFTATASSSPTSPMVNQPTTITTNVTNTGSSYTGAIIDTEIYANNGTGARVFQRAEDLSGQNFASGQSKQFTSTWTPQATGTYQIRVGVFGSNWSPLFSWTDNAGFVTVGSGTSTGTTTPPTGTSTDQSNCGRPGTENFNVCYYQGKNRDTFLLHRNDPAINFDWGQGSPDPVVPNDNFSARWLGLFTFDNAEYEFTVTTDDGIRLNVDNETILDKYFDQAQTTYKVRKTMPAGQRGVIVDYYENWGDAVAKVSWAKVGGGTTTPTTTPQNMYQAKYYDNPDFTNLKVTRNESAINNDWGQGSPDPSIGSDSFSAIWQGNFDFTAGNYTFSATHDDGARVYVDGQRIIDKWFDQAQTTDKATIDLTGGSHNVKMEYYENWGDAVAKLSWTGNGGTTTPTTTPDKNVNVSNTSQTASSIPQGGTNTFMANVTSPNTSNTVLVDLELYNSSGQKVAQKFFDNETIGAQATKSYQITSPSNLPAGNYYWSVGLFTPGWANLIKWYHAPQEFTVGGGTQPGGNVTLQSSTLGSSQGNNCPSLTAQLQNSTSNAKSVLVDFELRNAAGNLVNQYFVDNYNVAANSTQSLTNVCNTSLSGGQYTYSVGIFNPGWNGLINWYQATKTFTK